MTILTDNEKRKELALKAKIRYRLKKLHQRAFRYMKINFGTRKFELPKLVFFTPGKDKIPCYDADEVWGLAHHTTWTIYISTKGFHKPWFIINEILPHELAHMAMFRVNDMDHSSQWKKCAIHLGATGAICLLEPSYRSQKIHGVYTYRKEQEDFKVIGKPLLIGEDLAIRAKQKGGTYVTYNPFRTRKELQANSQKVYMNL
jgi:hypothetical protein